MSVVFLPASPFEAREARFMEEMEGYEPPPTIEDMMLNAAKKALVEHEAEKAKKEAKARKAAEKKTIKEVEKGLTKVTPTSNINPIEQQCFVGFSC